jgi:uracil-DNA glycosylase
LLPWVKEGVFLLNTALTVQENKPLSHTSFWPEFTHSLISFLRDYNPQLIWVFWGQKAKKIKESCQIADQYSLLSAHPSPYSAEYGFFHSTPFSRINQLLKNLSRDEINWLTILTPQLGQ